MYYALEIIADGLLLGAGFVLWRRRSYWVGMVTGGLYAVLALANLVPVNYIMREVSAGAGLLVWLACIPLFHSDELEGPPTNEFGPPGASKH